MEKDYLESVVQNFNDEATAKTFIQKMSKYIKPEQIEREGNKVTVHANNKGESWFLVLFSMNVIMQRKGLPVPQTVMECMVNLAGNFNNDELVNLVEKLFNKVRLNQIKIMAELSKM